MASAELLSAVLAEVAPRVRVERERVWVDGRGLEEGELASSLLRALASVGVEDVRLGGAEAPVVAWAAARLGASPGQRDAGDGSGRREAERDSGTVGQWENRASASTGGPSAPSKSEGITEGEVTGTRCPAVPLSRSVVVVPPGTERAFLAPLPLAVLGAEAADPRVLEMLAAVGVETCGALASLEREAVEVRLGEEGLRLWRLARGDDARFLFEAIPPERPQASLDFVDYVVTDPERLAFTLNALLGSICDALRERGEHARRLRVVLELAGGGRWEQGLRPGRASASRAVWLRLARAALDRATLPDAVAGVHVEVEATEPAAVRQGDLFDAGFASAPAVEAVVLRLLESQGEVVVRPVVDGHPLAERRVAWTPVGVDEAVSGGTAAGGQPLEAEWDSGTAGEREHSAPLSVRRSWAAGLPKGRRNPSAAMSHSPAVPLSRSEGEAGGVTMTLQLLRRPLEIRVETMLRRDHELPVRYRDGGGWHQLVSVAGPERVSGGVWEEAYAREYFRAVSADGLLVWFFRDARRDTWYLHGWWD